MPETVDARTMPEPDGEVSVRDIARWAARWWWLVLCGCAAGSLLGLI